MNRPADLHNRAFTALCDDLFDIGAGKAKSFQRLDALRSIQRAESTHSRDEGSANNAPSVNQSER